MHQNKSLAGKKIRNGFIFNEFVVEVSGFGYEMVVSHPKSDPSSFGDPSNQFFAVTIVIHHRETMQMVFNFWWANRMGRLETYAKNQLNLFGAC